MLKPSVSTGQLGRASDDCPQGDTLSEGHPKLGVLLPALTHSTAARPGLWGAVSPGGGPWGPPGLPGRFWASGPLPGAARRVLHPAHTKDGRGPPWAPTGRSPRVPSLPGTNMAAQSPPPAALTQDGGARALRRALASSQHGRRKARAAAPRWRRSP